MSNAEPPISSLPDAKTFLEGKDGIKPLQHKAKELTLFTAGFEEVPLAPTASEKLVQLGEVMNNPNWAQAHDAAHGALNSARQLVTENPTEELASHAYAVENIYKARAPSAHTVKGVKHPVLEEALKPLAAYLEEFNEFITGWPGLTPLRMKPKEGEAPVTPAQHRATTQAAVAELRASNPEAVIPECGDVNCTIDHSAGDHSVGDHSPISSRSSESSSSHRCGPGCGHDHAPSASSGGGVHYHGDTPCTHAHPHEPHVPEGKSKAALWIAGITAAVGVGAYLINEYGKPDKKKEWKARIQPSRPSEARTV